MRRLSSALTVSIVMVMGAACTSQGTGDSASDGAEPQSTPDATTADEDPIVFGGLFPLTGSGSVYGGGMQAALEFAVEEINAAGGINGRPVEVVVEDDGTDADQGVRAASKLLDVDEVDAIIGTWASSVTLAIAPLTIAADVVMTVESGVNEISDLDDNNTIFRIGGRSADTGAAVAAYLLETGKMSAAILGDTGDAADSLSEGFTERYAADNGEVVDEVRYQENLPAYATEVSQVVDLDAEAVALFCFSREGVIIAREAFEASSTATWGAPIYCINDDAIAAVGAEALEGWFVWGDAEPADTPAFRDFSDRYETETGENLIDNLFAASVYDGAISVALAMEKAGTTDGSAVGDAMFEITNAPGESVFSFEEGVEVLRSGGEIDYEGLSRITFDERGDTPPAYAIFTIQDGEYVFEMEITP